MIHFTESETTSEMAEGRTSEALVSALTGRKQGPRADDENKLPFTIGQWDEEEFEFHKLHSSLIESS